MSCKVCSRFLQCFVCKRKQSAEDAEEPAFKPIDLIKESTDSTPKMTTQPPPSAPDNQSVEKNLPKCEMRIQPLTTTTDTNEEETTSAETNPCKPKNKNKKLWKISRKKEKSISNEEEDEVSEEVENDVSNKTPRKGLFGRIWSGERRSPNKFSGYRPTRNYKNRKPADKTVHRLPIEESVETEAETSARIKNNKVTFREEEKEEAKKNEQRKATS